MDIYSVDACSNTHELNIPISLLHNTSDKTVETETLLDSCAVGVFIDQNYARKLRLEFKTLQTPVLARNVDGTTNKRGTIKNYVDLQFKIGDKQFEERFFVTGLGKQRIILGFPWLRKHNPEINWQTGTINWRKDNYERSKTLMKKWRMEREQKEKETGKKEHRQVKETDGNCSHSSGRGQQGKTYPSINHQINR